MSGELNIVGLGLSTKFLTPIALSILRNSDIIYFDSYTSISCDIDAVKLEEISSKPVISASRELLELKVGEIINQLREGKKVSIATIGDPMIATTHVSLVTNIKSMGFSVNVIPGISVLCYIISKSMLSSYKFGRSVTVTFPHENYIDPGAYFTIKENKDRNLHTILFLDLKESKAMKPNEAVKILLNLEERYGYGVISKDTTVIIGERLGCDDEEVYVSTVERVLNLQFNKVPYIIIIPAPNLHYMEVEALKCLKRI